MDAANAPAVSVVIPVGRVDDELIAQLDALDRQDFDRAWEIVLACNTTEPSEQARLNALVARYANARVVAAWDTRSASHARNRGAEEAKAEVLAFCDGDDLAEPDWLSRLVGALDVGRAVGGHLGEDQLAISGQENWRPPATPGVLPKFLGHDYVVSANLGIHRRDFLAVGGFDLGFTRCEDVAFSFALTRAGIELVYEPSAVIHYRHRAGMINMMRQHYLYGIGLAQVLARDGVPGEDGRSAVGSLRPNAQRVEKWSFAQVVRRGSLGVGRVVGMVQERFRR